MHINVMIFFFIGTLKHLIKLDWFIHYTLYVFVLTLILFLGITETTGHHDKRGVLLHLQDGITEAHGYTVQYP